MIINTKKHGYLWCLDLDKMFKTINANHDIESAMISCTQQGLFLLMEDGKATKKLIQW